jgi:hypothetical protein
MSRGILLIFAQALDLARDDQVFVRAQLYAMLRGEALGTFGHEIDMGTLAQNFSRRPHGIAQALDAAHAARA